MSFADGVLPSFDGSGWAVVAAVLLAFVGSGAAAPPDPFTQLFVLPLVGLAVFPVCRRLLARFPGSDGGRPFLAFVAGAVAVGWLFASVVGAVAGGVGSGLLSAVAFVVGVYAAGAFAVFWFEWN